jgi:hypothetical protein
VLYKAAGPWPSDKHSFPPLSQSWSLFGVHLPLAIGAADTRNLGRTIGREFGTESIVGTKVTAKGRHGPIQVVALKVSIT